MGFVVHYLFVVRFFISGIRQNDKCKFETFHSNKSICPFPFVIPFSTNSLLLFIIIVREIITIINNNLHKLQHKKELGAVSKKPPNPSNFHSPIPSPKPPSDPISPPSSPPPAISTHVDSVDLASTESDVWVKDPWIPTQHPQLSIPSLRMDATPPMFIVENIP